MRNTTRYISTLSAFLVAGALVHFPLAAQKVIVLNAPTVDARIAAAVQLERAAVQEKLNPQDWRAAAASFERAASVRGSTDPVAVTDLISAADIYEYMVNQPTTARLLLDNAGWQAERIGALDKAVQAYVGAFRIAMKLDDVEGANQYLDHLSALACSPGLSAEARKEFLGPVSRELHGR